MKTPFASPYWNQLASSQFLSNRIRDSIESSEYSIAINPDDEEALLNKANGMFSLGEYEEALTYYHRFNNLHRDDETGDVLIGITLINLDRPEEALVHLKKSRREGRRGVGELSRNLPRNGLCTLKIRQSERGPNPCR